MILHLTPEEFYHLKYRESTCYDHCGRFNTSEFDSWVMHQWGEPPRFSGRIDIVVRRDVPAIPWYTRKIYRWQEEV